MILGSSVLWFAYFGIRFTRATVDLGIQNSLRRMSASFACLVVMGAFLMLRLEWLGRDILTCFGSDWYIFDDPLPAARMCFAFAAAIGDVLVEAGLVVRGLRRETGIGNLVAFEISRENSNH